MILRNALAQVRSKQQHRMTEAERTIAEELMLSEQERNQHLDDDWNEMMLAIQIESRSDYGMWN